MNGPRVLNPDDHLETRGVRVYSEERNLAAWETVYAELESLFRAATPETRFYLVMGVQGGGKTTWIRQNAAQLGPNAICLDAALPARRHRARAMGLVTMHGVAAIAVWINPSLELALARNRLRPLDEQVPEAAIRSVFSLLEAPTRDEGFVRLMEVVPPGPDA